MDREKATKRLILGLANNTPAHRGRGTGVYPPPGVDKNGREDAEARHLQDVEDRAWVEYLIESGAV